MGRIRTQNILKTFKNLGYKTTLITLYCNKYDIEHMEEAKVYVDKVIGIEQKKRNSYLNCLLGLFLPYPLRIAYCYNKKMKYCIQKELYETNYDIVYIKRLRMAQYAPIVKERNVKLVIDITDSLTKYYDSLRKKKLGLAKLLAIEEYIKHKYYEKKICKEHKIIVICSEEDKKYLTERTPEIDNHIYVMNNSIDVSIWKNHKIQVAEPGHRKKLVFFGLMDYTPNILAIKYFIEIVFPLLDKEYDLTIVGANITKEVYQYESERIHFTGFVQDISVELKKYDIFVCPMNTGSGVKNKILQASMVGLPIISTDLGVEGIAEEIHQAVFIANGSQDMVDKIRLVDEMQSEDLLKKLRYQQEIIEKFNNNDHVLKDLLDRIGI